MKAVIAVCVSTVALLAGCATMLPPEETFRFSGDKAEFTFVKSGCVLVRGKYTDRSGKGNTYPYVKFIAVSNSGETVGEWRASCSAVMPNGTSSCDISGPKKAYFECANYHKFSVVN